MFFVREPPSDGSADGIRVRKSLGHERGLWGWADNLRSFSA
jgi:hypothetical protein